MRVFQVIMLGEEYAKRIQRFETVYFKEVVGRGAAEEVRSRD
jgi:hypothetical protein